MSSGLTLEEQAEIVISGIERRRDDLRGLTWYEAAKRIGAAEGLARYVQDLRPGRVS